MKKYIAPELEVELYTLDTSIAACKSTQVLVAETDAEFSAKVPGIFAPGDNDDTDYFPSGESSTPYANLLYGNPELNGGCDCKYTASGARNTVAAYS